MSSEQNFTDSSMQDAQQIKQGASNAMNIGRKASEMKKKYDAAKKAKEASGAAKTAAAAVGKAASGNVAGAAVEVAKSKEGKAVMILALIPVFLVVLTSVLFLYALPTMIFEGVQNYAEEVEESYNETVASSSSQTVGKVKAFFTTGGKLVTDFFSGIADRIKGTTDENDSFAEADVKVTYEEQSETETLKAKRRACTNKINQRINIISDDIRTGNLSKIDSYFRSRYNSEYKGGGYVYDTAEVNVNAVNLSEPYASEILSFYTAQTGGNIEDIKVSELLYWLGQKTDSSKINFKLGDQVDVSVSAWNGRFLPQYLLEQKRLEETWYGEAKTNFEKMQCSAADLLITVEAEDFSGMEPVITPEEHTSYKDGVEVTTTIYHVQWVVNVKVGCRDPIVLRDMAGLWDGGLNEEQDQTRLDNMLVGVGNFPMYSAGGNTTAVNFEVAAGYDASSYVQPGTLSWPIPGASISSKFGPRICPFHGREVHTGVDLRATAGTPILASGDGTVVEAKYSNSLGNHVTIHHGNGVYTSYYHMSKIGASVGQTVTKGQFIGNVGMTGSATGPHLHFVLMVGGINYSNKESNTNIKDPLSVITPG